MISTLNDVRVYTEHRASRSPLLAERVLLRSPGISAEEASVLEHTLPGLPASYLKCAKQFSLATVELGMAALRPRNFGGDGLVERLVLANSASNPILDLLGANGLYEVASWETDPIAVARESCQVHQPGEVLWIDIASAPSATIHPLTADFATFMVMAGRLWAGGDDEGFHAEQVLEGLGLHMAQAEGWRSLASMVL